MTLQIEIDIMCVAFVRLQFSYSLHFSYHCNNNEEKTKNEEKNTEATNMCAMS